ncbi:hypothetical protein B0O99DRAFT_34371 [Bisporella sp. PMI_857]|nr:hypothetical protein B0O99DRAFT_34371 [Bisporella sp. PMI_857]
MEELSGCWREALRCDRVSLILLRMRNDLTLQFHDHIAALLREIESTSRLLRDLHDIFPIYKSRVPIILYYLTVILPCLCRTLRDMMIYIDNEQLPYTAQWVLMNERLGAQGEMDLVHRFIMYIEFLVQLVRLLSRSVLYDPARLEVLRTRVLRLRHLRGIPAPPAPVQPHLAPNRPTHQDIERRHWAEKIFDHQPRSATGLSHKRTSRCYGPPMIPESLGISPGSTVLLKQPFNKNRLSVVFFMQPEGRDITRMYCRYVDALNNPMTSCYGVQELCIRRRGSCLQFRRWNNDFMHPHPTVWIALFFRTWERLVIFHAAFVALKARCPLTVNVNPDDYQITDERKLFGAQIIDDGFEHNLTVLQDRKSGALRLLASVWSGELRRCPVWTAFITDESTSPDWIERPRGSRHRIWIRDIQLFVFCQDYKKRHQIQKNGEFEIKFVNKRAADIFEDLFRTSDAGSEIDEGERDPSLEQSNVKALTEGKSSS